MVFERKKEQKILLPILLLILILMVLMLLILGWFVFDIKKSGVNKWTQKTVESNLAEKKDSLNLSNTDPEVGGVVEKVSRHILFPSKEITVATVKDAEKLYKENPVIYQYIKNGQKVLIYDTGAIVYDASIDKIVDVIQFYAVRQEKLAGQVKQ
ncbi:MAG: hypothetical protein UU49_C0026G0010 [Candidatus Magasanikbacteria bacterium GW2011_GWC2_41_17]|uniref:Uncharacterized protein n=2 Tax=Candidatus Magasanikiibacteriota TaxID=1752731 RepID=A0A0G0WIJ3_9BACT|nr:MAG: hypothetical protein UU49_C0026G0010 [Candidatus Magasanikbacteria bacterium GW2011_GWC2_41_17]KKS12690.1 MAG: hypothetical protein UU69_C0026G0006 [Candidatus Magasanikbacteria bacterium GW2011_GWA2_41_55]HBX15958.1 hypothetical protein [Candidatus Magasanikbacteria bacterium]